MNNIKTSICIFTVSAIFLSCSKDNLPNSEDELDHEITITEYDTLPYKYFYSIDFDKNNDLWLQTIIEDKSVNVPTYSSYLPLKSLLIKQEGEKYIIYDGLAFIDFFFESGNNLWMYNSSVLMTFDETTKKSEVRFKVAHQESNIEKVHLDSKDNIWIEGSKNLGILKQNGNNWEKQYSPSDFDIFHIDKNGDTYFATNKTIVLKYKDGEAKVLGQSSSEGLFRFKISCIHTDASNQVWVGLRRIPGTSNLLAVFNDDWVLENPEMEIESIENSEVVFMFNDNAGRLWVVINIISKSSVSGNICFVRDGNSWSRFDGIETDDLIWDYAFDKSDNLWFSTYKKGIFKVDF